MATDPIETSRIRGVWFQADLFVSFFKTPEPLKGGQRRHVPNGDRRERGGSAVDDRFHEPAFSGASNPYVEQQQPARRIGSLPISRRFSRDTQKGGAINGGRRLELAVEPLEQVGEILSA